MAGTDPIADLIGHLAKLPGIGEKTASRLAFHIMNAPEAYALASWRPARLVPTRRPIDALLALERTEFPLRLVWFDPQGKFSLSNAKAAKLVETRVVREFADGVVLDVELRVP